MESLRREHNDLLFELDTEFEELYSYDQFDSRDSPGSGVKMDSLFLDRLMVFTYLYGAPVDINSAYRTPRHNHRVGGAKHSAHKLGRAIDIPCKSQEDRYKMVYAAMAAGFPRVGIGSTFIHLDDKDLEDHRIWLYPKKRK